MKNIKILIIVILTLFIFKNVSSQIVYDTLNEYLFSVDNNSRSTNNQTTLPVMSSSEQEGQSVLIGGDLGGVMPLDIIYANNKYYVYGYHKLLVVNPITYEVIKSIDISNYGTTFPLEDIRISHDRNRLAFNTLNDELYCVTEDFRLLAIDTDTDEITETIYQSPNPSYFESCIISYDERTNKIFFLMNEYENQYRSNYYRFDGTTHIQDATRSLDLLVLSLVINSERDRMYLSGLKDDGTTVLQTRYQGSGGGLLESINILTDGVGKLLYINDPVNNIHKIVCFQIKTEKFPSGNLSTYVIDGNNDNITFNNYTNKRFTASTYYNNKYYAAYQGGFLVFDAQTDNVITDVNVSDPSAEQYTFNMVSNNNGSIICSFSHTAGTLVLDGNGAYVINCSDNSFSYIEEVPSSGNYASTVNKSSNETAICSFNDGSVHIIDNQGQYNTNIITGGNARRVVYCEQENKVYSYNSYVGKIFINSLESDYSSVIDLGYLNSYDNYISQLLYDKFYNRILVSICNETNKDILVIDCNTDQVEGYVFNTFKPFIKNMFIGENMKLYVTTGSGGYLNPVSVEIFDLGTLSHFNAFSIDYIADTKYSSWFKNKNNGDIIMSVYNHDDTQNRVWIIGNETNAILESFNLIKNPLGLQYNPLNNKVYALHKRNDDDPPSNTILVLDLSSGGMSQIELDKGLTNIRYCEKGNYLAALGNSKPDVANYEPAKMYFVDGESDEVITQFEVPNFSTTINYNEENGDLYLLSPFNIESESNDVMDVWNFDVSNANNSKVRLTTNEKDLSMYVISPFQTCFNTKDNQLIIATGFHSKLNIIECDVDKRKLNDAFNWVSFPKLKRNEIINEDQASIDALDNIDPEPPYITLEGRVNDIPNFVIKEPLGWSDYSNPTLKSTEGFKLMLYPFTSSWLPYEGTRMQANYPIYVQSGVENWVGYFLPQPQSPLDALSDLLPDLVIARGHDWTLTNISASPGNPIWVVEPDRAQVKYGDMVVVEVGTSRNFTWFELGESGKSELPKAEFFTFTEKADYTPLLVELDTTTTAVEIGAFVNDSCVGACVVETADTLVLIKAYVDTNSEDTISFQQYDGTKSTSANKIDKYFVKDKQSGIKIQRSIKLNENDKFYVVSFKNTNTTNENTSNKNLEVKLIPNPLTTSSTINFSLEVKSNVNIKIYGANGTSYGSKQYTSLNKGFHSINIIDEVLNGNKPKPGLYILNLRSDSGNANIKFVIN